MSKKKPQTHGGARKGAGRPAADDPKVKVWVSIRESKLVEGTAKIKALADKINKQA